MLPAGPRKPRRYAVAAVPVAGAGIDLRKNLLRPVAVAGIHRGGKPVFGIVHQFNSFLVAGYFHDADNGTKAFFLHHLHGVVHAGDNGGLKEVAAAGDPFAAKQYSGAFVPGFADLLFQHAQLVGARERAKVHAFAGGLPQLPGTHLADERFHVCIIYFFMHVDALHGAAALAVVVKGAVGGGGGYGVNVFDVVGNIKRIFPAQLQLAGHHAAGYFFIDIFAGFVRTGEEEAVKIQRQQVVAGVFSADACLESVFVHAGFLQQAVYFQAGEHGIFRRLVKYAVAGQQCGNEHVHPYEVRIIPRGDIADHAQGLIRDLFFQGAGVGNPFVR